MAYAAPYRIVQVLPLIMCSCNPILRYTSSASRKALRASRSAPLRPALCACRAARHRRNPPETEGTIRGHAIPQQGPVSYHTPQKSPPSRLGHSSERSRGLRALRKPSRDLLAISVTKSACTRGMSSTTYACSIEPRPYVLHATRSSMLSSHLVSAHRPSANSGAVSP